MSTYKVSGKLHSVELNKKVYQYLKKLRCHIGEGEIHIGLSGGTSLDHFLHYLTHYIPIEELKSLFYRSYIYLIDERITSNKQLKNYTHVYKKILHFLLTKDIIKRHQIILPKQGKKVHLDLILMGLGEDGHVASLFPYQEELEYRGYEYIKVNNAPKLPSQRLTISMDVIENAYGVFLFWQEKKMPLLKKFLRLGIGYRALPVKSVLASDNIVYIFERNS